MTPTYHLSREEHTYTLYAPVLSSVAAAAGLEVLHPMFSKALHKVCWDKMKSLSADGKVLRITIAYLTSNDWVAQWLEHSAVRRFRNRKVLGSIPSLVDFLEL